VTPARFGSFDLKTVGGRFVGFGPQNLVEDLGVAGDIIGELTLRRSFFIKGSWSSDVHNSTWIISPLGLSGSGKISRGMLGIYDSPINKDRGCPRQLPLPPSHLHRLAKGYTA
jgi:hypothetical protein